MDTFINSLYIFRPSRVDNSRTLLMSNRPFSDEAAGISSDDYRLCQVFNHNENHR